MNTITSGIDTSFSTKLNENFKIASTNIITLDTSTDLNFSISFGNNGSTGYTEKTKTFTFTSEQVKFSKYIILKILGDFITEASAQNQNCSNFMSISLIKNPSGTPVTIVNEEVVSFVDLQLTNAGVSNKNMTKSFERFYELSSDDKTNGIAFQIKIKYMSTAVSGAYGSSSFTNRQTLFLGV
jgi:hypothetical protein